ncbi:hypothetical protein IV203_022442 [Nitzschia inconspicua]|uniref:DUF6824 domain-containing protein n=1 Tax=Nitzschia inconspicua TaxID=303405 RepID=A0A9K3KIP7_9STRA|nr:hypothetical protein IV203_024601 [Nitzschia inconspicua]KAG7344434.1 hypothetical protein IV203_022442 [Nitzschia inconspicua]
MPASKDHQEEELPESFQPSESDVIVGWARQNYHHEGNQILRNIVRENVPRYVAAKTKHEKGIIIIEILETIKARSPSGLGILRQNPTTKRWFYIGTDKAKDKIGHALRKASRDVPVPNTAPVEPSTNYKRQEKRRTAGGAVRKVNNNNNPNGPPTSQSLELSHPHRTTSSSPVSSLASPQSAFSPNTGIARRSFTVKTGPLNQRGRSTLESWPLTSITSLSSSESHNDEAYHHQQPVQVTVPSSPVTRPGSAASNPNHAPPALFGGHYHHHDHSYPHSQHHGHHQETRHERQHPYHHHHHHHHSGGYYSYPTPTPYHPQHYAKEPYDYHGHHPDRRSHSNNYDCPRPHNYSPSHDGHHPVAQTPRDDHAKGPYAKSMRHYPSNGTHRDYYPDYPASARVPLYENLSTPSESDVPYHRVFDEVDRRLQQEEQQQQHRQQQADVTQSSYQHNNNNGDCHEGYHRQHYYPPVTSSSSTDDMPYARIVSNEGMAVSSFCTEPPDYQ